MGTQTIHIHIGPHKTGSTAIQRALRENAGTLQKSLGLTVIPASRAFKAAKLLNAERLEDAAHAIRDIAETCRAAWAALLQSVDVLVLPAAPIPPPRLGAPVVAHHADLLLAANLTGCAAAVMPCGVTSDGLPLAVQLMAPRGADRRLVRAMRQLEPSLDGRS